MKTSSWRRISGRAVMNLLVGILWFPVSSTGFPSSTTTSPTRGSQPSLATHDDTRHCNTDSCSWKASSASLVTPAVSFSTTTTSLAMGGWGRVLVTTAAVTTVWQWRGSSSAHAATTTTTTTTTSSSAHADNSPAENHHHRRAAAVVLCWRFMLVMLRSLRTMAQQVPLEFRRGFMYESSSQENPEKEDQNPDDNEAFGLFFRGKTTAH